MYYILPVRHLSIHKNRLTFHLGDHSIEFDCPPTLSIHLIRDPSSEHMSVFQEALAGVQRLNYQLATFGLAYASTPIVNTDTRIAGTRPDLSRILAVCSGNREWEDEAFKAASRSLTARRSGTYAAHTDPSKILPNIRGKALKPEVPSSQFLPETRKRKAEDGLPFAIEKSLKMQTGGGPRAGSARKDPEIGKNTSEPKSSSIMALAHKNVAKTGSASASDDSGNANNPQSPKSSSKILPADKNRAKALSTSKEFEKVGPLKKPTSTLRLSSVQKSMVKLNSASKDSNTDEATQSSSNSKAPKDATIASSTSKDTRPVLKPGKPILSLNTSTLKAEDPKKSLKAPDSPPPKKGSYRELMSRKMSDMPPPPPGPKFTCRQIKAMAQASKRKLRQTQTLSSDARFSSVRARTTSPRTDSHYTTTSPEEKQRLTEAAKRLALNRVNRKFPRSAYRGTGAIPGQASSRGTTEPSEASVPLVRTASSSSASSADTSGNDMEVGFMQVEKEESQAARDAKKEDEEQAQLEVQLKQLKERRKMREALKATEKKK